MIDPEEIAHHGSEVLAMMQTPGWAFYCKVIMDKIAMTHEAALADEPGQLLYHRGSVDGLRAAVTTAQDIMNITRDVSGERRETRRQMADAGLSTF